MTSTPTGVILFGHGSRLAGANDQLRELAGRLRASGRYAVCEAAFLELAAPAMPEAVRACVEQGARRVVIVPYFLAVGRHVAEDIPRLVEEARRALGAAGEGLPIEVTDVLGSHPGILDMVAALVEARPSAEPAHPAAGRPSPPA